MNNRMEPPERSPQFQPEISEKPTDFDPDLGSEGTFTTRILTPIRWPTSGHLPRSLAFSYV